MGWRTIIAREKSKIDFRMNYLCVRQGDRYNEIFIKEIDSIILESTAISVTAFALNELIKEKVNIVFCNEKRNPSAQLLPLQGSHDSSQSIRNQINWSDLRKQEIWTKLVEQKIKNQAIVLKTIGLTGYKEIEKHLAQLTINDETNREGHAAKEYFKALFGNFYSRKQESTINAALNYGYSILLSCINREIASKGYLTQLGIGHCNVDNPFNLGSDLIEPLRYIVDWCVINNNFEKFEKEEKMVLCGLLDETVLINNTKQSLKNAINIYVHSVINALESPKKALPSFIDYELQIYENNSIL